MSSQSPATTRLEDHLHWLFATPVITYRWPNSEQLNRELEELVLARESRDATTRYSNAGGWQSSDDLLAWGESATDELKRRIDLLLFSVLKEMNAEFDEVPRVRFRIDCWANVNRKGDYNVVHSHPNALWSGVYYVSSGNSDPETSQAGKLELLDPREAAHYIQVSRSVTDNKCFMNNEPGLMILFPGWLRHMVHPHGSEDARISIAFNALPVS